jgi:four helix bundle protein
MAPVTHFSKLIVWQLADAMRQEVFALTAHPQFARDLKLRSQIEDAAHSVCRNIAEGFGCRHKEFARFLRIARRSINEVQDAANGAVLKGYLSSADLTRLRALFRRIYPGMARLIAYLDRTPDPPTRCEWR